MLTKNEATERAKKIWGDNLIVTVVPGASGGEWFVEIDSGVFRCHLIDGNGHPICHPACSKLEAIYCEPQQEVK